MRRTLRLARPICLFFALFCSCFALKINDYETDLYSKNGRILPIAMQLELKGSALEPSRVLDSINTVISGYYYEDIFTQAGKESLKETIIKYAAKKHSQNIDEVLILRIKSLECQDLLERLEHALKRPSYGQNLYKNPRSSAAGASSPASNAASKIFTPPPSTAKPTQFDLPEF